MNNFPIFRYDIGYKSDTQSGVSASNDPKNRDRERADMEVNGPGSIPSTSPIRTPAPATPSPGKVVQKPATTTDNIEISAAGQMLDKLQQSPEVRAERLAQIKAAIDAGEYETPAKLEAALERMINEIGLNDEA